ncbi:hypothetical protein IWW45_001050, partial [Coemansia sp. RSA 485]
PFFNQLRNQQQLGYAVGVRTANVAVVDRQVIQFYVVGSSEPEYFAKQVEAFIEGCLKTLAEYDETALQKFIEGVVEAELAKQNNPAKAANGLWSRLVREDYGQQQQQQAVDYLREITRKDLVGFWMRFIGDKRAASFTCSKGPKGGKAQQQSLSIFHLPTDLLSSLVLPSQLNRRIRTSQPAKASSSSSDIVDGQLSHRLAQAARVVTPQCSVCGGIEFGSGEEQRRHFKTATHEANLVRRLVWRRNHPDAVATPGEYPWEPLKAEEDEQSSDENESAWSESDVSVVDESVASAENNKVVVMLGNHGKATMDAEALVEEIEAGQKYGRRRGAAEVAAYGGNSDDSSSEDADTDEGARRDRGSSPWLWFASEAGVAGDSPMATVYGVQRRILIPRGQHGVHTSSGQILHDLRKMQLPVAPKQTQQELKSQGHSPKLSAESSVWVILATNGGYFAGAVFDNRTGQAVAHKTFQRYTTRRKQGGSQARQDNAMGRLANSAGAQIRRYNEQKLQEEIRDLMGQWREYLQRSERVFVRVARTQRKGFFAPPSSADGSATQPIRWSDPRVRSVPVPMARPSLAELLRVYRELTTVRVKAVRRAEVCGSGSSEDVDGDKGGGTQESQLASAAENNGDAGSESDHTLDAEPRPDLLAFLHHVAKMVVNQEQAWADQQIVDYLDKHMRQLLDALSDPAIGLRYLQDTDLVQAHRTPTLLHLASAMGRTELVPYLMDHGEDPTVTNGHPPLFSNGKTAYEVAKDEKTKDAFLAYRLENAGDADNAIEWSRSGMPDQELDTEQREQQQRDLEREARAREKKRRDRERKKAKEKARKQQKALEDAEKADAQALEQAQKDAGKQQQQQEQLASLSQSELRARMLSMAYASAGRSWGGGPVRDAKKKPEPVAQRPVSPGTQRARDRELRFQAAERRRQQQQQQNQGPGAGRAATGECTHCGRPLHGLVPFEQFDWRCCSIKCLQDHRLQPH